MARKIHTYGEPMSWSHISALGLKPDYEEYFGEEVGIELHDSWEDILEATGEDKNSFGVLAVENSSEKNVGAKKKLIIDALVDSEYNLNRDLQIVDETAQELEQVLVYNGEDIEQADKICSHPAGITQAEETLRQLGLADKTEEVDSTSKGIEMASENDSVAAIGSPAAAEAYDVDVYNEDIQDNDTNTTRFLVLGTDKPRENGDLKSTMLVDPHAERPGVLWGILTAFLGEENVAQIVRGQGEGIVDYMLDPEVDPAIGEGDRAPINLVDVESREKKDVIGDYRFWIDVERPYSDPGVQDAVSSIEPYADVSHLGTYPNMIGEHRESNGRH